MSKLCMPEIGTTQTEVLLSALKPGELLCVRSDSTIIGYKADDIDFFLRVEGRPGCSIPLLSINDAGQWMHFAGSFQTIALKKDFALWDFETRTNGTVHYGTINEMKILNRSEARQFLSNFVNTEYIYADNIVWSEQNYIPASMVDFNSLKPGDILFILLDGKEVALKIGEIIDIDFFRVHKFFKDENSIGRVTYLPRENTYHQSNSSIATYYIPCLAHHEHFYSVHLASILKSKVTGY